MLPLSCTRPVCSTTVAHCLAHGAQALIQGRLADKRLGPDMIEQFLLAHHPVAVADEIEKDGIHLGFERTWGSGMAQFMALDIEFVVAKNVNHHAPQKPS